MSNPRRASIEAAVEAFLASGGIVSRPESRQLRAVATRDNQGRTSRTWADQPPAMGAIGAKDATKKKPPRRFR